MQDKIMANRSIRVTVLEGDFATLSMAGFPLSLCMQLQTSGLKLCDAMWTAKSSAGGFSVSFFWPGVFSKPVIDKEKKQKRRKRRRKTKANKSVQCGNSGTKGAVETPISANSLVDAHHSSPEFIAKDSSPIKDNLNADIDLKSCSNVKYDKRGAVHGVTYTNGNEEEAWTPVVSRRSKKPKRSVPLHLLCLRAPPQVKSNLPSSDDSDSDGDSDGSDADLVVPDQANVKYSIINGKPGLQINTKCTRSWTPIAARTRAKLKSN